MFTLSPVDALDYAAVFEDAAEELHILGKLMPSHYQYTGSSDEIVRKQIGRVVSAQHRTEDDYDAQISQRSQLQKNKKDDEPVQPDAAESQKLMEELTAELKKTTNDLKTGVNKINRMFNQNPLTADNMKKVEKDRNYFEKLLTKSILALNDQKSIEPLKVMVEEEQQLKNHFFHVVRTEEESRQRIKELTQSIQNVRQEKITELARRAEVIAYQKDQLQEAKAKAQLEITYEKKKCENHLEQIRARCSIAEQDMRREQDSLENRSEDEMKSNSETENYLRVYIKDTTQKTEDWLEKYNQETAALQTQLDKLKSARASDLAAYQKIAADFTLYEKVVREDRAEKERRRRQLEREQQQMFAAVKIQSWWRGMLVRNAIGPYKKKKGKKGKKKK
ncbi:unnamed protein product [Adineta steineri]|uniref:Dynein regulatory complex protein 9 n=1 Tax=Adineta steineri TaxID=433720 RepID=A0A815U9H2_9BILA|nr:unnamed protein product [Adineta steineri]CAF1425560.1 unnamed protein product [Adineta steineri]CAF1512666.1 unnamed protein product [Adineta steineri]CAF1512889.1 unnamed protein product [Adineta steineri]